MKSAETNMPLQDTPTASELPKTQTNLMKIALPSFAIILALAVSVVLSFEYDFFSTWLSFAFMCLVPTQLVITMVWKTQYPTFMGKLPQPMKGICFTLITIGIGSVAGYLMFTFAGKGIGPPTPMLMNYTIMVIVVTFWFVPILNCWPLTAITKNPLALGLGSLMMCYGIAWILFRVFFNFSFMEGAPVYVESLDPKGLLQGWTALSFFVTTVQVILILLLSDMSLVPKIPGFNKQPLSGLLAAVVILVFSAAIWFLFVKGFGLDPAVYLIKVPVCFIFGVFMVNTMMQGQLLAELQQPMRGLMLTVLAGICALGMYYVYAFAAPILAGVPLPSGAPAYQLELWIANALLAVTFPIIVIVADYFEFWPFKRN